MKKVLCFGDSNTYGFNPKDGTRFNKDVRWTGILKNLCADKFQIFEEGCNNRTAFSDNPAGKIYTGCKFLPEILNQNFEYIIFSVGINDLQYQYEVTIEDINTGIKNLVNIVRQKLPDAKIILISPTELTENVLRSPVFSTLFDKNSIEKSKNLSKIYKQIAAETGSDFIDLNLVATVSSIDGLHFEADEHRKIAVEILQHLK